MGDELGDWRVEMIEGEGDLESTGGLGDEQAASANSRAAKAARGIEGGFG